MSEAPHESEQSDVVLDPKLATPKSVSWLSFYGKKDSSSHDFVQKVQRIAFQQGKQRDDEWVADFAATCFSGEALEWYIGLDEETQTSWRKLRAGLIRQWPIESGKTPNGNTKVDPAHIPASAPATAPPHSLPRTLSKVSLGTIQVQWDGDGGQKSLGYVALDAAGTCIIQQDAALALVVGCPVQLNAATPCHMSIEGPEDVKGSIAHTPLLGLSLLRPLGKDPDTVHAEVSYASDGRHLANPIPSGMCCIRRNRYPKPGYPLATWYVSLCPKDPPGPWRTRTSLEPSAPASAVFAWTLDPSTLEIGTTWLMPDGTLHDLETYVDNTNRNSKLHMHRGRDIPFGNNWDDIRVRLYFTPI